jgi:hypothetical protein
LPTITDFPWKEKTAMNLLDETPKGTVKVTFCFQIKPVTVVANWLFSAAGNVKDSSSTTDDDSAPGPSLSEQETNNEKTAKYINNILLVAWVLKFLIFVFMLLIYNEKDFSTIILFVFRSVSAVKIINFHKNTKNLFKFQ